MRCALLLGCALVLVVTLSPGCSDSQPAKSEGPPGGDAITQRDGRSGDGPASDGPRADGPAVDGPADGTPRDSTPSDGPAADAAQTCTPGGANTCGNGLTCKCCGSIGPAPICLCSADCTDDTACAGTGLPHCNKPGATGNGICTPEKFNCCWLCQ